MAKPIVLITGGAGFIGSHAVDAALEAGYAVRVVDNLAGRRVHVVGAGDALLAYATLAMMVSGSPAQATVIGSMAAACECEQDGNVPVAAADVLSRIDDVERRMGFQ